MKFKILISVLLVLLGRGALALDLPQREAWREDIVQLQALIKEQHIDPFVHLSEQAFDRQVKGLVESLSKLEEAEVEARIMQLMRSIGDAHTSYNIMSGSHRHFPFRFKYFAEELRVVDATEKYRHLLGAKLVGIEGHTLAQLQELLAPVVNYVENPYSYKFSFSFHLTVSKFLYGTGVTSNPDSANFHFIREDQEISMPVESVAMQEFARLGSHYIRRAPQLDFAALEIKGIALAIIDEYRTAYIDFDSYPELQLLRKKCDALTKVIRNSEASNLIIDFRGNNGGDFYVGLSLSSCLQGLEQLDWLRGIFVLTDEGTQSAAMSNAALYQQILNATTVGSPTGADPNIASETNRFMLNNSKRTVSISKRYYRFVRTPSDALYPDLPITTRWQDYKKGRDGVLLTLLKRIQEKDTKNAIGKIKS